MDKGKLIARGRTAEVFAWDDKVLKLFLEGRAVNSIEHEAQVTSAVHKIGLPVPSVEGIVQVQNRLGIVLERVNGPSMLQVLRSNPWRIGELTSILAKLHFQIHSYEMPQLSSLREDLKKTISEQMDLPEEVRETVLGRLEQLPDGNAICHLDFHPDNIIMSSHGPVVIDWTNVKRGDPLADVTATSLLLRASVLPQFMAQRWLINMVRGWFRSGYLKKYQHLRPASRTQMTRWELPLIAGRLVDNIPEERDMILAILKKSVL